MTEKEILREAIKDISVKADYEYCHGCDISKRAECLGWEAKVKSGKYGKAEYSTHKLANEAFGKHKGLHIALKILEKALADTKDTPPKEQDDEAIEAAYKDWEFVYSARRDPFPEHSGFRGGWNAACKRK